MIDPALFHGAINLLEMQFIGGMALCLAIGYAIGAERESRGKDAGISTHILVISGSMLFTTLSVVAEPTAASRIAAQVVSGIGFLCAGLILREGVTVKNLTTAASLWFAAAIGMAIGFGYYLIATIAGVISLVVPRIPHATKKSENHS